MIDRLEESILSLGEMPYCAPLSRDPRFAIQGVRTVGYSTQDVTGGKLYCIGLQFGDVGVSGDLASIAKLATSGITPGAYDTMETDAPCIMIYNGVGYDCYYYISDAFDAGGNEVTAWANGLGDAMTGTLAKVGEAFWVRSGSAGTLTIAK